METNKEYCLEVWGSWACFTRPELKVERVSYDVITPSAGRAIFDAIFWKPAISWHVTKIEVLSPIKWTSIRRNEVGAVAKPKTGPIYIQDKRQQRNTLLLKDVHYRIHAVMHYKKPEERTSNSREPGDDESPLKYQHIFERRAGKGQCFTQPYLGNRDFSAFVRLVPDDTSDPEPIAEDKDLGIMLYDLDYESSSQNGKGRADAMFYRAEMKQGVIIVPEPDSQEILR